MVSLVEARIGAPGFRRCFTGVGQREYLDLSACFQQRATDQAAIAGDAAGGTKQVGH